jgi:hypothetical protein
MFVQLRLPIFNISVMASRTPIQPAASPEPEPVTEPPSYKRKREALQAQLSASSAASSVGGSKDKEFVQIILSFYFLKSTFDSSDLLPTKSLWVADSAASWTCSIYQAILLRHMTKALNWPLKGTMKNLE